MHFDDQVITAAVDAEIVVGFFGGTLESFGFGESRKLADGVAAVSADESVDRFHVCVLLGGC